MMLLGGAHATRRMVIRIVLALASASRALTWDS